MIDGDGCSAKCMVETGWVCSGPNNGKDHCIKDLRIQNVQINLREQVMIEFSEEIYIDLGKIILYSS